jgi:hypothetical protein
MNSPSSECSRCASQRASIVGIPAWVSSIVPVHIAGGSAETSKFGGSLPVIFR